MTIHGWVLVFGLACGADATTTHVGLTHGATEQWLPTQRPLVADALIAGQCAGVYGAERWIARQGHPRLARAILVAETAIRLSAASQNAWRLR